MNKYFLLSFYVFTPLPLSWRERLMFFESTITIGKKNNIITEILAKWEIKYTMNERSRLPQVIFQMEKCLMIKPKMPHTAS